MTNVLKFLHVGSLRVGAKWHANAHAHPFAEILLVASGKVDVEIGKFRARSVAGDVLCYPADTVHSECSVGGTAASMVFFHISGELSAAMPLHTADRDGRVTMMMEWLMDAQPSIQGRQDQFSLAIACAIVEELLRLSAQEEPHPLARVRSMMHARLKDAHTVDALADFAGMSRFHFMREYKRFSGHPPMADLRRMRVSAAVHLLLTSDQTLKQIAEETGFCDEYYFSRAFKQELEISPGEYRRNGRVRSAHSKRRGRSGDTEPSR
jgi:AraC-like DNA-binding protein